MHVWGTGKRRLPFPQLQALQEEGYATPVSSSLSEHVDELLEQCSAWAETARRAFAKRNSGLHLDRALAAATQTQSRALQQLENIMVRSASQAIGPQHAC